MELFNTSNFSSKSDAARDFEVENLSSKKNSCKKSHPQTDKAWDDGSAFPSSKNWKVGDAGDGKPFKVGQRCEIVTNGKYLGEKGHICGQHEDGSPEFWVKLDNHDLQIRVYPDEVRFFSQGETLKAIEEKQSLFKVGDRFQSEWSSSVCTLIKIRANGKKPYTIQWENGRRIHCDESWLNEMKFFSQGETLKAIEEKEVTECNLNTPASLRESPVLNLELEQPEQANSLKQNYSLKTTPTLKQSSNTDFQTSQSTAILQTITLNRENSISTQSVFPAPAPALQATEPDLTTQNQACGFKPYAASPTANPISPSSKILRGLSVEDFEQCLEDCEWSNIVGTIHKSFQQRNSERRTSAKGFSSLPTPTTYAKGSTGCRPAGATRLEQSLKKFITKGDKLNPGVPGWMMGFPVGWVESTLMDTGETISVQLPFTQEYATTLINAENLTTSTPDQSVHCKQRSQSSESVTSPRTPVTRQSESIPEKFLEDKKQSPSIEPLSLSSIESNTTPENSSEESTADTKQLPSRKRRQRKGCLYKYLENKKLKNGNIASYPRVIGETRDPDNPKHWRWGFNWEEKIDGEWKGRSIGSIPIGAIALIQSMQKSNIPLEEIISFIKRSKNKE